MTKNVKLRYLPREFGVEVQEIDCTKPVDNETAAQLKKLLHEHPIVLFRNQEFTPAQLIEFCKNLGDIGTSFNHLHDRVWQKPDAVAEDHKIAKFGNKVAAPLWHTDLGESDYAGLFAKKATGSGANLWSNGYTAYRCLSEKFKALLEDAYFIYDSVKMDPTQKDYWLNNKLKTPPFFNVNYDNYQPKAVKAICVNPITGAKALSFSDTVTGIAGMRQVESTAILDFLKVYTKDSQFVYAHEWQDNDLLLWDLKSTQHRHIPNNVSRELHRISIGIPTEEMLKQRQIINQKYSILTDIECVS